MDTIRRFGSEGRSPFWNCAYPCAPWTPRDRWGSPLFESYADYDAARRILLIGGVVDGIETVGRWEEFLEKGRSDADALPGPRARLCPGSRHCSPHWPTGAWVLLARRARSVGRRSRALCALCRNPSSSNRAMGRRPGLCHLMLPRRLLGKGRGRARLPR